MMALGEQAAYWPSVVMGSINYIYANHKMPQDVQHSGHQQLLLDTSLIYYFHTNDRELTRHISLFQLGHNGNVFIEA